MFHVLSSDGSIGFKVSWKHLQWKSYLSITCVTRKVNTKVGTSICSCLFWRVAVQATLQNAGSGIFQGGNLHPVQHTRAHRHTHAAHTHAHTHTCTPNKELDANNKFHSYSLMLWLSPPLVLTIPWKLSLFLTTALSCSPRQKIHTSRRHSLFCTIFRLGRHTKPHISFHSLHVQV